jgi:hypothetical protein
MVPNGVRAETPDAEILAETPDAGILAETPDVEVPRAVRAQNEVIPDAESPRAARVRSVVILAEALSSGVRVEESLRVGDLIVGFHSVARIGFQSPASRRHASGAVRFLDSAFPPSQNQPPDERPLPTVALCSPAQHSAHY